MGAHVNVVGWYGEGNIGDEAFKPAFEHLFKLAAPKTGEIEFSTSQRGDPAFVILGGGDVIKEFYLQNIGEGLPLYPIGVGLGYETELELLHGRNVPLMVVRNKRDEIVARRHSLNAIYAPDLTFVLPTPPKLTKDSGALKKRLLVLLTDELSPWHARSNQAEDHYHEYFKWELASAIDELSQYYFVEFIAFSTVADIDDRRAAGNVYRRLRNRNDVSLNDNSLSVDAARVLISQQDLVISMKYHGILFAVQTATPFINIGLTRKTALFCEENNLQNLSIPPYSFTKARLLRAVKEAEAAGTQERLRVMSSELNDLATRTYVDALTKVLGARGETR